MSNYREIAAELKSFSDRKVIIKEMRQGIRTPVPYVRKAIKDRAIETLPKRGGLNKWVASTRITAQVKITSRILTVKLKGGRNSQGSRSDMDAIDRGRVRAPSWPKKSNREKWHSQNVTPGFFTKPAEESLPQWLDSVDAAVDRATEQLRR